METKRAPHPFDLSQETCQEQSVLETPRRGMDPAVPVVLSAGWSWLMLLGKPWGGIFGVSLG